MGDISGPNGLLLVGRTLYVTIGSGDATVAGPIPGTELPNPNPSSPLYASILAIHFSANVEKTADGLTLTLAHQQALAQGKPGRLLRFKTQGGAPTAVADCLISPSAMAH
ncbi:MAG TPA: hypothetical protein VD861_16305, partial [Pyrinomonadaceae bacterium]|nr:hypothetical protein [Pyrinomonadaceae bacterium]